MGFKQLSRAYTKLQKVRRSHKIAYSFVIMRIAMIDEPKSRK